MKRTHVFFHALIFTAALATAPVKVHADDQLRTVQQTLKDQGFYYGEVDGEEGSETNAAIRRYQIRNGLQVTGKLNTETAAALGLSNANSGQSNTVSDAPQRPAIEAQPPDSQPNSPPASVSHAEPPTVVESDKNFLRRHSATPAPAAPPSDAATEPVEPVAPTQPPAVQPAPATDLSILFQRTPYERAPLEVQRSTLERAQVRLYREGLYRGAIDGALGPETQRALLEYQRDASLAPTGRLDMDTLAEMDLLPNRRVIITRPVSPYDVDEPYSPGVGQRRVYRGIWVH